ncbi:acetyl-CoA carboxylase biotin carboxyl carrier protein [Pseudoflavonifractor sp. SW1122]|uniref:acetyl-CoA carboxylase biotin carboxyl carrier protein n=1 Tax=Pseudoflavonifractor sp. SW1122 TaxID=2530044 RepID=UPI00143BE54D|nr:acetyl-CoA carboxylase biotin carboxyl carrier protein [Pseudoflavonifractor sp. SW1122]NJE73641.1 acetyl-CoA carboxylase biotin carboxyl carrier protein [Pseudoflavonifractor sp. SW1122]
MTNQEIYELMARFDQSGLTTLKVTRKDFSLELGKNVTVAAAPMASVVGVSTIPTPEAMADLVEEGTFVTAPLVGTFYAASAPGEEPYVKPGQKVQKGDVLCLVEAMKTMNEIKAPCDCVVEEVLAQDGDLVSYGQNLIRYREG